MAYSSSTLGERTLERLSTAYVYVLLAMLPIGAGVTVLLGVPSLARRGLLLMGLPAIGTFLVIRSRNRSATIHPLEYRVSTELLQVGFVVALCSSVVALALVPYRPWYYFGLVALLYVFVTLQIVAGTHAAAIVAQLAAIMLSWTYGLTLKYGLFFGGTSTFMHRFYADLTASSGGLVPADLTSYALFPLYHTFVAGVAELLGVSVTMVIAAFVPIPFVATIAFVYVLARGITGDERIGQLTALCYSLHPVVLYASPYAITRTMAFVGFVALLYVAYSRRRFTTLQYGVLTGIFVTFIAFVHHVSSPQILSLLLLLAVCERLLAVDRFAGMPFVALGAVTALYWGTIASQFTQRIAATFLAPGKYASPDVVGGATGASRHLTYYVQTNVLVFLVLLGIGVLLVHYAGRYEAVIGLFALCTFVLYVPSPIHVIGQAVHLLRMDRYAMFLSPFVAFVMAMGFYGVQDVLRSRSNGGGASIRVVAVVVLVGLLAVTSVTAASTASNAADSRDLAWTGPPVHFTDEELRGMEFVPERVPAGSRVAGDWQTARFYRPYAYDFRGADRHDVPIYDRDTMGAIQDVYEYEGYLVVRTERLEEGELLFGGSGKGQRASVGDEAAMAAAVDEADVIYANGDVRIYQTEARNPPTSSS